MKNITVAISNEGYLAARVWAAERGVSLSRIVAHLLETLPQIKRAARRFPVLDQTVTETTVTSTPQDGTP